MENKINIAELLKDCPKGMELDCTMYDNARLEQVDEKAVYPIVINIGNTNTISLTKEGHWNKFPNAKCVIFPKDKTTWEGFVPPIKFKDGDVVISTSNNIHLISCRDKNNGGWESCCGIIHGKFDSTKTAHVIPARFATEEEKQLLFDTIKASGYKWNAETKTLEELPRFKVGDRIKHIVGRKEIATVVGVEKLHYNLDSKVGTSSFSISLQREWELVPNKFDINTLKPFDSRVLVRDDSCYEWEADIFGRYSDGYITLGGGKWKQCIPYEGNEHLFGTTNDCDEFYKTWEK